jgi:Phosphate/sulphate permeases
MVWFLLSSGLFLGWSLGANDAANIFGTAVATRMVKFRVAAFITSIFIVLGAVYSGAGATHTLSVLGEVNAIGGAFTVALSAAIAVTILIRRSLPVSISQSIVGAIIGWNLFTSSPTDLDSLYKILLSWLLNPLFAGLLSFGLYNLFNFIIPKLRIHLLTLDKLYRVAMIFIFVFGAYSLGANNISKVVGVFVDSAPFNDII